MHNGVWSWLVRTSTNRDSFQPGGLEKTRLRLARWREVEKGEESRQGGCAGSKHGGPDLGRSTGFICTAMRGKEPLVGRQSRSRMPSPAVPAALDGPRSYQLTPLNPSGKTREPLGCPARSPWPLHNKASQSYCSATLASPNWTQLGSHEEKQHGWQLGWGGRSAPRQHLQLPIHL